MFGSRFPANGCRELPGFRNKASRPAMRSENGEPGDDETRPERARFGDNLVVDVINADVLIGRIGKHPTAAIRERNRPYVRGIETDRRVSCAGASTKIGGTDLSG